MTYVRNPRDKCVWESDGDYTKPGFKSDYGIIFDSAKAADAYDAYRRTLTEKEVKE